jgi:hypothetical protein
MKTGEIWLWDGEGNYRAEFRSSKTLTEVEFEKAYEQGYLKELTLEILSHVIAEVQEWIDSIKKEKLER